VTKKKKGTERLEARVGGVVIATEAVVQEHPKHGRLIGLDVVRRLELEGVAKLVASASPLSGEQIRFIRRVLRIDQANLAALLGLTRQTVIRYEQGENVPIASDFAIRFLAQVKLAAEGMLIDLKTVARAKNAGPRRSAHASLLKRPASGAKVAV
jgi:DNA-binding transcriptional regulator YiaG